MKKLELENEKTQGSKRSSKWPSFRRNFLKGKSCSVCGGTKKLEAHHIKPFHLDIDLELDENNLISLCENKSDGINCHLAFGHLGNFKSFNIHVQEDSRVWSQKIKGRP